MPRYNVIGDWGTSRLRLFRVENRHIVARCDGPGIGAVGQDAPAAFTQTISPWLVEGAPQDILLCGMVGARDGWVEAPYASCPADYDLWRSAAMRLEWQGMPLAIMAGLACISEDGVPDVMRGEETQIFGAIARDPALAHGRHIIVLPGTHSKWALVDDGRIIAFRTAPTGEIFALLRDRSTLGPKDSVGDTAQEAIGFTEGLARAGDGRPLASLFAARSMRLRAGRSADWALGYLSGLLIGAEIVEMQTLLDGGQKVTLIGDAGLADRYASAFAAQGVLSHRLDGDACALAGLGFMGDAAA